MKQQTSNIQVSEPEIQIISDKLRIYYILSQCIDAESPMQVRFDNCKEVYSCKIIDINSDQSYLLLTSINPIYGQSRLEKASQISLITENSGAEIHFKCQLQKSINPFAKPKILVKVPTTMEYCQRRRTHRIHVGLSLGIQTILQFPQEDTLQGQLRDISAEGMRIQFRRNTPNPIDQLNSVSECVLALPDKIKICCDFEIRHFRNHQKNRGFDIGGTFIKLASTQRHSIEQFIAEMERKARSEHRI